MIKWRYFRSSNTRRIDTESVHPKTVIPNVRSIAGDLEPSFGDHKLNSLKQSGVPARAPQGLRLAGMTLVCIFSYSVLSPDTRAKSGEGPMSIMGWGVSVSAAARVKLRFQQNCNRSIAQPHLCHFAQILHQEPFANQQRGGNLVSRFCRFRWLK